MDQGADAADDLFHGGDVALGRRVVADGDDLGLREEAAGHGLLVGGEHVHLEAINLAFQVGRPTDGAGAQVLERGLSEVWPGGPGIEEVNKLILMLHWLPGRGRLRGGRWGRGARDLGLAKGGKPHLGRAS